MRCFYLLAILLCLCSTVEAQTLERSFGLELEPQYSQARVGGVGDVAFSVLNEIDSLERGGFGYGAGLVYESRIDRIGYTTGIRYTRTTYRTLDQVSAGGDTYRDRVGGHYLAIPFDVNFYQDINEDDRVHFLLGAAVHYHLGTRLRRTVTRDGQSLDPERLDADLPYRSFIPSFAAGIGYDRKLSPDWAIRFQPTFRFFLNGNLKPDPGIQATRNYYQIGLKIVLRRLFI